MTTAEILAIPLDADDRQDRMGARFGRAPAFLLVDLGSGARRVVPNPGSRADHGAGPAAAGIVAEEGATVAVAPHFGERATEALRALGLRLAHASAGAPVEELIEAARAGALPALR